MTVGGGGGGGGGGYPIHLDARGMLAVVVGLGAVGRRRAAGLAEAGAVVRGVDPRGADWAEALGVEVRAEPYRADHLDGARLAIAAAGPAVDRAVVADARARGILVASASEPGLGDCTIPASWRDGPVCLAVSTGGASPALAADLRDRAARAIPPGAVALATILVDLRVEALGRLDDPDARRRAFRRAADPAWLDRIARDGPEVTRRALREALGLDGLG